MAKLSSSAHAKQAALLRRYVASLPEKHSCLEECWLQVEASDFSPGSIAKLRDLAHRLAGSAGSYGFDSLGDLAAALDDALDVKSPGAAQRRRIGLRAAELLQALDAAMK